MNYSALLLDFDGTVCATETAAYASWVELFGSFGMEFSTDLWGAMRGRADGEALALRTLESALRRRPTIAEVRWRRQRKLELANSAPAREGIRELILDAAGASLPLGLVSNSPRAWVSHHLRRLELDSTFDAVVCREDVPKPKPAPDPYLSALSLLQVEPTSALAVEDSLPGLLAARRAGVECVLMPEDTPFQDPAPAADACRRVASTVRRRLNL
jgi:HAD superfamily hydrolase (TIGR01509 family)